MKRILLTLVAIGIIVNASFAQKIKLISGDISIFKSISSLNVEFVYPDDMKVGKLSQQEYVASKKTKAESKEAGAGEKWEASWLADRTQHYEPKFMELLTAYLTPKNLIASNTPSEKYTMVVKTIFTEPGFNIGVTRKPAYVDLEITLIETDTKKEVVKILLEKAPGNSYGGGDFDTGFRIGEAYAKAAKSLAGFIIKKAKL
ncbi:MAG: hypothetical protein JXR60_09385 [Bacteroidales bacterium]|nr:hypothetical protein [Bacteroidales bacterium]